MQKIVSFFVILAILYYLAKYGAESGFLKYLTAQAPQVTVAQTPQALEPSSLEQASEEPGGNFLEKTLSQVLVNTLKTEQGRQFFEHLIQPQNRMQVDNDQGLSINTSNFVEKLFRVITKGEGQGGRAICGHIVTADYVITTMSGAIIEEMHDQKLQLGTLSVIPGLDNVIVGMMAGQEREAIIPAKYAFYPEAYRRPNLDIDASYKVNVKLKDVMPHSFINPAEVKMFDDRISYTMPLLCGDHVQLHAKITKLSNGEVLFDSKQNSHKKFAMNIGALNMPLIFSYALDGKIPVGSRTVIAKGHSFNALGTGNTEILPTKHLPNNEYFMLELSDIDEVK